MMSIATLANTLTNIGFVLLGCDLMLAWLIIDNVYLNTIAMQALIYATSIGMGLAALTILILLTARDADRTATLIEEQA